MSDQSPVSIEDLTGSEAHTEDILEAINKLIFENEPLALESPEDIGDFKVQSLSRTPIINRGSASFNLDEDLETSNDDTASFDFEGGLNSHDPVAIEDADLDQIKSLMGNLLDAPDGLDSQDELEELLTISGDDDGRAKSLGEQPPETPEAGFNSAQDHLTIHPNPHARRSLPCP